MGWKSVWNGLWLRCNEKSNQPITKAKKDIIKYLRLYFIKKYNEVIIAKLYFIKENPRIRVFKLLFSIKKAQYKNKIKIDIWPLPILTLNGKEQKYIREIKILFL